MKLGTDERNSLLGDGEHYPALRDGKQKGRGETALRKARESASG
jgi:hypothetical protein